MISPNIVLSLQQPTGISSSVSVRIISRRLNLSAASIVFALRFFDRRFLAGTGEAVISCLLLRLAPLLPDAESSAAFFFLLEGADCMLSAAAFFLPDVNLASVFGLAAACLANSATAAVFLPFLAAAGCGDSSFRLRLALAATGFFSDLISSLICFSTETFFLLRAALWSLIAGTFAFWSLLLTFFFGASMIASISMLSLLFSRFRLLLPVAPLPPCLLLTPVAGGGVFLAAAAGSFFGWWTVFWCFGGGRAFLEIFLSSLSVVVSWSGSPSLSSTSLSESSLSDGGLRHRGFCRRSEGLNIIM